MKKIGQELLEINFLTCKDDHIAEIRKKRKTKMKIKGDLAKAGQNDTLLLTSPQLVAD